MMQQSSLRGWCVSQKFSSWLNVYQLDSVLHKEFTLDVAEKIAWNDIRRGEEAVVEAERQARLEKEKQEDMKFTQQVMIFHWIASILILMN